MEKVLTDLIAEIEPVASYGERRIRISGVADNSKKVKKGFIFIAIAGLQTDGHDFIGQAIEKGALAVVGQNKPENSWLRSVTYIRVENSRKALSFIASSWFGYPSRKLKIIGVTGTDGKTTTATLIYHILATSGKKAGLISTVEARIGEKSHDTGLHVTNPEAIELHKLLKKMVKEKCEYCVMEVTSHGLDQERVAGVDFEIGVLTNITHEHLDYHKTKKNYFESKMRLFRQTKIAVVLNKDDKSFNDIYTVVKNRLKVISYGIDDKNSDLVANNLNREMKLTHFDITFKGQTLKVSTTLPGKYNASNILAAVACAKHFKVSDADVSKALKIFTGIEGRMEEIKNDRGFRIFIDFAHTPASLENVLKELKKTTKGKLVVVFGCAGERDKRKRRYMPRISVNCADVSVFTAEDPRSEDINQILDEMSKSANQAGGMRFSSYDYYDTYYSNKRGFIKIPERGEAIYFAINNIAQKGDTVVICGKGHEKSMSYAGVEYPWSDHEAVRHALKGLVKQVKYPKSYYLKDKKVAVLGYGIEGETLVRHLLQYTKDITVYDKKGKRQLKVNKSVQKHVNFVTGTNYLSRGLDGYDYIFRSPGVYRYLPEILHAEKKGARVSSEIKLFFDLCPAKIIGVTGTKGKGTTATLIYKILKASGKDVYLAGNIGITRLKLLQKLKKSSIVVLELSSFQLIDLEKSPHIAVVLNITPDHLDWHKDYREYLQAKENIVNNQNLDDCAVLNADYNVTQEFDILTKGKVKFFSRFKRVNGCYVKGGKIVLSTNNGNKEIGRADKLLLRGEHNWENVSAAITASYLSGARVASIKEAVFSFKGLEHRLEFVREVKGVKFYNDSFATGPQPTIAAISSFNEPETLILGGYDKGLDYSGLGKVVSERVNVKNMILIGDVRGKIKKELKDHGYRGGIFDLNKSSMEEIVDKAFRITQKGGVVILSPAAASFDMFESYKERGELFKKAVRETKGK